LLSDQLADRGSSWISAAATTGFFARQAARNGVIWLGGLVGQLLAAEVDDEGFVQRGIDFREQLRADCLALICSPEPGVGRTNTAFWGRLV
jgi:hypothetical protein